MTLRRHFSEPASRISEILDYTRDHPEATDDQYTAWLGEVTKRLCPECKTTTMTRYESWNGACEGCKPAEGL